MSGVIEEKKFISVDELAEVMRISTTYAYEFVKKNDCPFACIKMGKRIIIPTNDFLRWYKGLLREEKEVKNEYSKETVENIMS